MAKRGREAMAKRARERARQEKKEAKREKREARTTEESSLSETDEHALMDEFARLSEKYQAEQITQSRYDEERERIFSLLGIETE